MKITHIKYYGGAQDKVVRLGLAALFFEVLDVMLGTDVRLSEERRENGAAQVRKLVDARFSQVGGWTPGSAGGIDWRKERGYGEAFLSRIGVEVQVSARSDLLVRDLLHLRNSLQAGEIDIGVIVVPSDRMQRFLPDRTPALSDAVRYIEVEFPEAKNFPIIVVSVEHDGPGEALPKQRRRA